MIPSDSHSLKELRSHGTQDFPCAFYHLTSPSPCLVARHHWHEELEIISIIEGSCQITSDMETRTLTAPCLCFFSSGQLHSIYGETPYCLHSIVFQTELLSGGQYDSLQTSVIQPLKMGRLSLPFFITSESQGFHQLLEEFSRISAAFLERPHTSPEDSQLFTSDTPAMLRVRSGLLGIFAGLIEMNLLTTIRPGDNTCAESTKKVLTYIKEHYTEKIYIGDLASLIGMNQQYFCRFFKKALGRTPVEYINDYRIRKAMDLLSHTDKQVTEICLDCGFHNLGNFLKEFRKTVGCTPLQYRKK